MPFVDMSLADLESYAPTIDEPDDFDAFWRSTIDEANDAARAPSVTAIETPLRFCTVHDVRFSGFGGHPIAAWLLQPKHGSPRGIVVEAVGYGGGRGFPHERLSWVGAGYAHLIMDTRGQGGQGASGDTPDPVGAGTTAIGHMTRGIQAPESYYYRRVFTDAVRAIRTVRELEIAPPERTIVAGGSQGGGIAIAASALVGDVAALLADMPFLCHFRRAVGLTGQAPYEEIASYLRAQRDEVDQVFRTLSYFDGAIFSARANAPALFSVALQDGVCPPSTVFAMANRYAGPKEIEVYPYNAHEGGGPHHRIKQFAWLDSLLDGAQPATTSQA